MSYEGVYRIIGYGGGGIKKKKTDYGVGRGDGFGWWVRALWILDPFGFCSVQFGFFSMCQKQKRKIRSLNALH